MELFVVYLWLKLESLRILSGLIVIVVSIWSAVLFGNATDEKNWRSDGGPWRTFKNKTAKLRLTLFLVTATLAIFLPSKTDVALLVGSSIAIDMKNSPEAAKVSTLLRQQANKLLDEAIKEKP